MACYLRPTDRDLLVRIFRSDVYLRAGFTEFPHQAEVRLASEGYALTHRVVEPPIEAPKRYLDLSKLDPRKFDTTLRPIPVKVIVPCLPGDAGAFDVGETGNTARYQWQLAVPRLGGVAHNTTDLAAFKAGKSKGAAMWVSGFACLPGATIELVGAEYKTSEHEFNYLIEALLSGAQAPFKKYKHLYNDVKAGRMYLELYNGCSFEVRSWTNKDTLRGGQISCYLFTEVYQLPGLEIYTGQEQNLRAEKGLTNFSSTPDRPWVQTLHKLGHGKNPDWHCSCGNTGNVNPLAFSIKSFMESAPDWDIIRQHCPQLLELCVRSSLQPGRMMSSEKFLISHLGMLGEFVGSVYAFQEGQMQFTPSTHPQLWKPSLVEEWQDQEAALAALREA